MHDRSNITHSVVQANFERHLGLCHRCGAISLPPPQQCKAHAKLGFKALSADRSRERQRSLRLLDTKLMVAANDAVHPRNHPTRDYLGARMKQAIRERNRFVTEGDGGAHVV